jgi:hypothetical protein
MSTPPVGGCSVLVCDGLFLCIIIHKKKENVFGFLCMGEKLLAPLPGRCARIFSVFRD